MEGEDKMKYAKYKNPDKQCQYPFDPNPFGYCWSYATMVDKKATRDEIIAMCKSCEYFESED